MKNFEFKNSTKEMQLKFLNPLIEIASEMLIAGTLKKNVVIFFINKGTPISVATNLMEIAEVRASNFSKTKFR